jgi:pyruvate decarboxylase
VRKELQELLEKTGFPVYSAPMGKGAVNEQYERYGGVSTISLLKLIFFIANAPHL